MIADDGHNRAGSNRRLMWAAIGSFALGTAPVTSNILASASAHALGCYIAEYEIFTGTPNDYVDDPFGCRVGQTDVGPFLVGAHEFIYAILITWPLALLSLFLFTWLFYRLARGREAKAPD